MAKASKELERLIRIKFRNQDLLLSALTHQSSLYGSDLPPDKDSFQRLEFFGDAIVNRFIAERLYHLYPEANEGFLSRLRSILVSRRLLSKMARSIRLKSFLTLSREERAQPLLHREKLLADAFEALSASIYFDRGQKTSDQFLNRMFKPFLNQKRLLRIDPNPKSALQEYSQKAHASLPVYETRFNQKQDRFVA